MTERNEFSVAQFFEDGRYSPDLRRAVPGAALQGRRLG
jgi:hypothetical protein